MFGTELKKRREAVGMSQRELAHRLGYADNSTLSKVETSGGVPRRRVLEKLMQIFPDLRIPAEIQAKLSRPVTDLLESGGQGRVEYRIDEASRLSLSFTSLEPEHARRLLQHVLALLPHVE